MNMESKIEKESLVDCLSICRINSLNKEWDGKKTWLKAIVRVKKCDNSVNYAIAENDGKNNASVIRDFGNMARIKKIEAIYPTYYLQENQKPDLRNKSDIVSYLNNFGYDRHTIEYLLGNTHKNGTEKTDEQKKLHKEKVKSIVNFVSIRSQLDLLNEKINANKNG